MVILSSQTVKISHLGKLNDHSGNEALSSGENAILALSQMQHDIKTKPIKEAFDMNMRAMEQFEVLNLETLETVEGGTGDHIDGGKDVIKGMITGIIGGIPGATP
ncbi:hypothetical protein MKL29_01470 [Streptococcus suis]|nr:hypothetical protein [Streptococcus suis]